MILQKAISILVFISIANVMVVSAAISKRDTATLVKQKYGQFRENCFPRASGGCKCSIKDASGNELVETYGSDDDCKLPSVETILNKGLVTEHLKEKFGDFKENCFPKPSGGCECNEKNARGEDEVVTYHHDADCKLSLEVKQNKQAVNDEIKARYGNFRENCFPKPSGGCRCNEVNALGRDITMTYQSDDECRVSPRMKRATRDPVREKAQQNYAAVVNELKEKFANLREGCYPRPKGCLCVIGRDRDGRDITERRMKDSECKCKPGEVGNGCPAAA